MYDFGLWGGKVWMMAQRGHGGTINPASWWILIDVILYITEADCETGSTFVGFKSGS